MPYSSESRRIRRSQWGGFGHESSTVDDNLTIIRRGLLYRPVTTITRPIHRSQISLPA
jgi:hypothetical protein